MDSSDAVDEEEDEDEPSELPSATPSLDEQVGASRSQAVSRNCGTLTLSPSGLQLATVRGAFSPPFILQRFFCKRDDREEKYSHMCRTNIHLKKNNKTNKTKKTHQHLQL